MRLGFALAGDIANSSDSTREFDETIFSDLLISITVLCVITELIVMFWSSFGEKIQPELLRLKLAADAEWEEEEEENPDNQVSK